jgi:hypothetical protein
MSFATLDDTDLGIATRELAAAREMLGAAHAIEDRRDRQEAFKVAAAKLALASRAIDVVAARRANP